MTELRSEGYEPTETECPFCEEGGLWVNSFELVCDNCGGVIRKGEDEEEVPFLNGRENTLTYNESGNAVLPGAYLSPHHGPDIFSVR